MRADGRIAFHRIGPAGLSPALLAVVLLAGCRPGGSGTALEPATNDSPSSDQTAAATGGDSTPRLLGILPPFSLVDQHRTSVTESRYFGKAWVANFIFTTCLSTCPQQTMQLADLSREFAAEMQSGAVRFVSFTVDPEHDSPEVLARYAAERGIDSPAWDFVTGTRSEIGRASCRERV